MDISTTIFYFLFQEEVGFETDEDYGVTLPSWSSFHRLSLLLLWLQVCMLVPFRLLLLYLYLVAYHVTRFIWTAALYPGLDPMHRPSLSTKPCTSTYSLVTSLRTRVLDPFIIEVTALGRKGSSLIPRPDPGMRLEATTTPVPRLLRYPKLVGKGQKIFQSWSWDDWNWIYIHTHTTQGTKQSVYKYTAEEHMYLVSIHVMKYRRATLPILSVNSVAWLYNLF